MLRIPRLSCFTSERTSSGTFLLDSLWQHSSRHASGTWSGGASRTPRPMASGVPEVCLVGLHVNARSSEGSVTSCWSLSGTRRLLGDTSTTWATKPAERPTISDATCRLYHPLPLVARPCGKSSAMCVAPQHMFGKMLAPAYPCQHGRNHTCCSLPALRVSRCARRSLGQPARGVRSPQHHSNDLAALLFCIRQVWLRGCASWLQGATRRFHKQLPLECSTCLRIHGHDNVAKLCLEHDPLVAEDGAFRRRERSIASASTTLRKTGAGSSGPQDCQSAYRPQSA
jgi:hypothetical protein